jgi:hypothetical protein
MRRRPSVAVLGASAAIWVLLVLQCPMAWADNGLQSAGTAATGASTSTPSAASDPSTMTTTTTTSSSAGSTTTTTSTTSTSPPTTAPPAATPPATTPPATTPPSAKPPPPATPITPTPSPASSSTTITTTTTATCGGSTPAAGSASATAGTSCGGTAGSAAGLGSAGSAAGPSSTGSSAGSGSLVTAGGTLNPQPSPTKGPSAGAQPSPSNVGTQQEGSDPSAAGQNVAASGSGPGDPGPPRISTETTGTHSGGPATSDPTGLIGIAATLAGGYQGAPAPVGATCAGTGPRAGCDSPGLSPPPQPGIADARHSSNLTIAGFVAGFEPPTARPAPQRALSALGSSTRRSVVPPAASRLGPKPDPARTAASPPAVQPAQPEVAMSTRGPKGPQGGAGSFAGGAGAPSTLIIMLAIALIAACWSWYVRGVPLHLQTAESYRLERPG